MKLKKMLKVLDPDAEIYVFCLDYSYSFSGTVSNAGADMKQAVKNGFPVNLLKCRVVGVNAFCEGYFNIAVVEYHSDKKCSH